MERKDYLIGRRSSRPRESGVRCFVVEQDRSLRDAPESIEISFKNLRAMGLS